MNEPLRDDAGLAGVSPPRRKPEPCSSAATATDRTGRYTPEELCELYLNEDAHTEHVTRLALALFDAVQPWTRMTRNDRRVLEAAALLHDVGYAVDPRDHLHTGVEIVREEGVEGYPAGQWPYIRAAMGLHQGRDSAVQRNPALREVGLPKRALRIGALLAIADGLDQSHIQDASIRKVRREEDVVIVTVASPLSPDNLTRAETKAGGWRAAFPIDIRFEPDPSVKPLSRPAIQRGENLYEAIRRQAYFLFKRISSLEDDAREARSADPLHDLRVALRRLRVLLNLFRKPLENSWAGDIGQRLGAIGRALGPARDYDVQRGQLDALERDRDLSRSRVWKQYRSYQSSFERSHRAQVRRVLGGSRYRAVMQETAYFLRIQLPECARQEPDRRIDSRAARSLWRKARAVLKSESPHDAWDAEALHALRKRCRRNRYAAEFFGGALGPATRRWGRIMKAMADASGDWLDAHNGLERAAYDALPPPRVLVTTLRRQRTKALQSLASAWAAVQNPSTAATLKQELDNLRKRSAGSPRSE